MINLVDFNKSKILWIKVATLQDRMFPFYEYEWHKAWYDSLRQNYTSMLLNYKDKVLLPLSELNGEIIFSGGDETSDYQDAIGIEELKREAWEQAMDFLKVNGYKSLNLRNIPDGESLNYFIKNNYTVDMEDTTPFVKLPKSFEEYLGNLKRKYRKELNRKVNKFERDFANIVIQDDRSLDCLIGLMKKNVKKEIFFKTKGMERYFKNIHHELHKAARIECLLVGSKEAASIFYFETEDSFLLYNSGFDKQQFDGAGFYLVVMSIKKAIEKGKKYYNFLQGNERYKYELGGKDKYVYRVKIEL